jgi:hypothetical protein
VELEHRLVKDGWYGYLHYDLRVWQDGQVNLTARSGGEDGVAALEGETVSRVAFTAGMHAAASGCTSSLLTDGQTASCPRQEQDSIAAHVRTSPPTNGFTRISIRQLSANPHASP